MSSQKIHAHWANVAWGGAGNTNVISEMGSRLRATFPSNHFVAKTRDAIKQEIISNIVQWNTQIYQRSGPFYASTLLQSLGANHMFVGYGQDGPFILVVYSDHIYWDFIDAGYAAIGSGEIFPHFALAGLNHFDVKERTLFEAKVIAYRVVDNAIGIAAFGLGYPIQIVEIPTPPSGQQATARKLTDDQIVMLEDKVAEWTGIERETLENLVGVSTAPAETGSPPEPPTSQPPESTA